MQGEIRLESGSVALSLQTDKPNPNDWTRCYFVQAGAEPSYLGAEALGYLVSHLVRALAATTETDPKPASRPTKAPDREWILSLSEAHHCLYLERLGSVNVITIRDYRSGPPPLVGTIELTPEQTRDWVRQLREVAASLPVFLKPPLLYEMFPAAYLGWSSKEQDFFLLVLGRFLATRLQRNLEQPQSPESALVVAAAIADLQFQIFSRLVVRAVRDTVGRSEADFIGVLIETLKESSLDADLRLAIRGFLEKRADLATSPQPAPRSI